MLAHRNWTFARVAAAREVAQGVREILLEPESGARPFPAGAHIAVKTLIGDRVETRHYSLIGAAPSEGRWRIAVKREEPGRGGSAYMWSLPVGARLEVAEPRSHFDLSRNAPEYLLVAGGIGITPLLGMAARLKERGARFRLLYAGRSRASMPFIDELHALLGERLEVFASDEGRRVNLDAAFCALDADAEAYVCGPIRLMEGARAAWAAQGRASVRCVIETFGSSGKHAPEPFTVRVTGYERSVEVAAGQTMLDALEAAGVGVIADCRRGECGLCAVDIVSHTGEIDHRDVFFSKAQHAENSKICACVSRVKGGEIVIDPAYRRDEPLRSGPELKTLVSA